MKQDMVAKRLEAAAGKFVVRETEPCKTCGNATLLYVPKGTPDVAMPPVARDAPGAAGDQAVQAVVHFLISRLEQVSRACFTVAWIDPKPIHPSGSYSRILRACAPSCTCNPDIDSL